MKNATPSQPRQQPKGFARLSGTFAPSHKGKSLPTVLILKSSVDVKAQHLAIGKLVKMCKASPVVAKASRGITAEVRRDRDRGHN